MTGVDKLTLAKRYQLRRYRFGHLNWKHAMNNKQEVAITEEMIKETFLKLGHFFGLETVRMTPLSKTQSTTEYRAEGSYQGTNFNWIAQTLTVLNEDETFHFEPSEKKVLETLKTAFKRCATPTNKQCSPPAYRPGITQADKDNNILFLKNNNIIEQVIKKGEPFIVPAGWQGHGIGLSIIGNRLLVTNTGARTDEKGIIFGSGTAIYDIDCEKLTEENIAALMQLNEESSEYLKSCIQKMVKNDATPVFIPHKPQKVANCGVSNPKKMIKGLLACMKAIGPSKEQTMDPMQVSNQHIEEQINAAETTTFFKKITGKNNNQGMRAVYLREWARLGEQLTIKQDRPIGEQTLCFIYKKFDDALNKQLHSKQHAQLGWSDRIKAIDLNDRLTLNSSIDCYKKTMMKLKRVSKDTPNGVYSKIDAIGIILGLDEQTCDALKDMYTLLEEKNAKATTHCETIHQGLFFKFLQIINTLFEKIFNKTPFPITKNNDNVNGSLFLKFLGITHSMYQQTAKEALSAIITLVDECKTSPLLDIQHCAEQVHTQLLAAQDNLSNEQSHLNELRA